MTLSDHTKPDPSPWAHQEVEFERSADARHWMYSCEQRTGKSRIVIGKVVRHHRAGEVDALLVVAMPGLAHVNWITDELPAWLPSDLPRRMVAWSSGRAHLKSYQRELEELLNYSGLAVLAVNGEAVLTPTFQKYVQRFLKAKRTFIAADEQTLIMKSPSSQRTKAMWRLGRHPRVTHKVLLDGTPVGEGPFDLYAPTQFLGWGLLGHTSYLTFKQRYAEWTTGHVWDPVKRAQREFPVQATDPDTGEKVYKNLDELYARLAPFTSRVLRRDCFDLPDKVYAPQHRFDLSKEQQRVYDALRDDFKAEFTDGLPLTAPNILARYLKLQMVTSNLVPAQAALAVCLGCQGEGCGACDDLGAVETTVPARTIDHDHHPRLEALAEQVDLEPDARNVVWCRFTHDVDDVMAKLTAMGRAPVRFDGRCDQAAKIRAKQAFQEGRASDLVGSARAGGRALKLAADSIHYYSNEWPLLVRLQSEDRAEFVGMAHGTGVHDYVARGTVDEDVVDALRAKRDVADLVLNERSGAWI